MKKIAVLWITLMLLFAMSGCGSRSVNNRVTTAKPTEYSAEGQVTNAESNSLIESSPNMAKASVVYAAFLGQYEGFSSEMSGSFYVKDVNADGYPEIVARPAWTEDGESYGVEQFMVTYTDRGGLCVIRPNAHSSMGVHFRVSGGNCLYYTDDGHNVGTYPYHTGYVYSVDETGFKLLGQAIGDEWPDDLDSSDLDLMTQLDEKYDGIFADKIQAITGDKVFVDCMETELPEYMDGILNDLLQIDLASARNTYKDAQNSMKKAVSDAAGQEPQSVFVSDYDRDGTYEAFAFVADSEMVEELQLGSVWFVNTQGEVKQIQEDVLEGDDLGILSCTYHDYFQAPLMGGSSMPTNVWEVRDGDCRKVEIFDVGENGLEIVRRAQSVYLPPDTLISTHSAFDMSFSDEQINDETGERFGAGHTHKPYFFRDTPEGLKEYGGIQAQPADIEKLTGGKTVIELAQQDGKTIESIYYRENGVFSISVSEKGDGSVQYYCLNTILAGNELYPLRAADIGLVDDDPDTYLTAGFYKAAVCPDNATFPAGLA